jgi:hypothetical protein
MTSHAVPSGARERCAVRADVPEENEMDPKTKAEATQAMARAAAHAQWASKMADEAHDDATRRRRQSLADSAADEAERLRALLPTLPD